MRDNSAAALEMELPAWGVSEEAERLCLCFLWEGDIVCREGVGCQLKVCRGVGGD